MLDDDVRVRLDAECTALKGRVEGAAELTALVATDNLPQSDLAAFVFPNSIRGGRAEAAAGIYRQGIAEIVSVVLVVRYAGDATGAHLLPSLRVLVGDVIAAIAGWAPENAIGVFTFLNGRIAGFKHGSALYQLDFSIDNQLRI